MSQLNIAMNAGRQFAHRLHMRFGANGLAGAGLVLVALIGLLYAQQAHHESAQLQAQAEQARALAAQKPALAAPARDTAAPAERLARFQNWFPAADTATADLRKIFAAARRNHLDLARGEYNLTAIDGSSALQKFDVIFPVKEHYGAVKSFVADVLNQLPHASLAELRVERPASAADELDTRVHFTLYYRATAS